MLTSIKQLLSSNAVYINDVIQCIDAVHCTQGVHFVVEKFCPSLNEIMF